MSLLLSVTLAVVAGQPNVPALPPGCLLPDNQTDLWCPGARGVAPAEGDESVACYKIPSLLRTANGTLLAFIEARQEQCGDGGLIDLHLRRSFDGGKTWTHTSVVYSEDPAAKVTIGDACPVQDRTTGIVHLVFTRNNKDVYYTRSADQGATWSAPRNISGSVDGHRDANGFVGTGHAGGLQLASGRLLVPMHGPCHMIYSDDGGDTWLKAPGSVTDGGECQAVEVRPGLIIATARHSGDFGFTVIAYSDDDGMTWNASVPNHDLPSPIDGCEASIVVHPNGKLYHSGPNAYLLRTDLVVKVSEDLGATWQTHTRVWDGAAGYSAMAVLGSEVDSPIALLYDRNNRTMIVFEARGVTFTTVAP